MKMLICKPSINKNTNISIIVPVLNNKEKITRNLESICSQMNDKVELIIIDGKSTDGTQTEILKFSEHINYFISEPDHGISDAFNKGIKLSTSNNILILNSDDWLSDMQIKNYQNNLKYFESNYQFLYGNIIVHKENIKYIIKGDLNYHKKIETRMPSINHPTILIKKTVFDKIGLFNKHYKFAMDYDLLLRAHIKNFRGKYINNLYTNVSLGGVSDKYFIYALNEQRIIAKKYNNKFILNEILFLFFLFKSFFRRILEFFLFKNTVVKLRSFYDKNLNSL